MPCLKIIWSVVKKYMLPRRNICHMVSDLGCLGTRKAKCGIYVNSKMAGRDEKKREDIGKIIVSALERISNL